MGIVTNTFYARVHELYEIYAQFQDEENRIPFDELDYESKLVWYAIAGNEQMRVDAYKEEMQARIAQEEFKIMSRYKKREKDFDAAIRAAKNMAEQAWSALLEDKTTRRKAKADIAVLLQGLEWIDDANNPC